MSPAPSLNSLKMNRTASGCLATFLLIGLLIIGVAALGGRFPQTGEKAQQPDELDACLMAQYFIRESLKAPSTAKFPSCRAPGTHVTASLPSPSKRTASTWSVSSYVDAQNAFGAQLRADTYVQMTYQPTTETWTVTSLDVIAR